MKGQNKTMRGYAAILVFFALVVAGIFGYRYYIHVQETKLLWPDMAEYWRKLDDLPYDATVKELEEMGYQNITQVQSKEIQEISEFLDPARESGKRILTLLRDTEEGPVLLVLQRNITEKLVALDTYVVHDGGVVNPGMKYDMESETVEKDGVAQVWLRWHRVWSDEPEREAYLLYSYRSG